MARKTLSGLTTLTTAELQLDEEELRQDFVAITAIGVASLAYIGIMASLFDVFLYWPQLLICSLTFASFVASYLLRSKTLVFAYCVYVIVPATSACLLSRFTGNAVYAYLAPLAAIINFQLSIRLGLASLVLNTLGLVLGLPPGQGVPPAYILLWAAAGIEFVSTSGRMRVLQWAWNGQQQAHRLLEQLRNDRGELNRTLVALTETTRRLQRSNQELKAARQEAEEARSLKAQFVANVSHELRTPLNLILGFAELMYLHPEIYEGAHWTPALESDIHEIYRASKHLQGLVEDVLDLSRIDALQLPMFREMQPLEPIIAESVETVAPLFRQRGLAYAVECPDPLPEVFVDSTRIRQVLINLLNNAARFTDSGHVTVQVRLVEEAIEVAVADTGVGIAPDMLETVFQEFRQADSGPRHRGGAGLGLALSRRFVQLHGGQMWAESVLGKGTTVFFTIPLPGADTGSVTLRRLPDKRVAPLDNAPVVLVDPDPSLADMLRRYLEDRPIIWRRNVADLDSLIDREHPVSLILNRSPKEDVRSWTLDRAPGAEHRLPIVQCAIPSPSWFQTATGMLECLTKPITTGDLERALNTYCPEPAPILVVDDDPGFVALMQRMLATVAPDYPVVAALSAQQALRLLRAQHPKLIFLDLVMPEVDGLALLEMLRSEPDHATTSVVAVTATSYAEEALRQRGEHFLLSQPGGIPVKTLIALVNAVLTHARPDYASSSNSARANV